MRHQHTGCFRGDTFLLWLMEKKKIIPSSTLDSVGPSTAFSFITSVYQEVTHALLPWKHSQQSSHKTSAKQPFFFCKHNSFITHYSLFRPNLKYYFFQSRLSTQSVFAFFSCYLLCPSPHTNINTEYCR